MCVEIKITSPETINYNCFAWAAGELNRWWNPNPNPMSSDYWPPNVRESRFNNVPIALLLLREIDSMAGILFLRYLISKERLQVYLEAYRTIGYETCDSQCFEPGFEKIAIYVNDNGKPTHAARQLPNGQWTSKIGMWEDVEHEFSESLAMEIRGQIIDYGTIAQLMKRFLI
jgi:hypothetical protein